MAKNIPNNETYELISEWLETYRSTDNERKKTKAKTLIVTQMIPVVKHIAKTIARRQTDPIEDLVQAGFIGLLKAIDTYSKDKNDNFRIYAGYFIIGEMKHFLRDKLNTIRVPRHIQELSIRISNFTKTLTTEEVQNLTTADVASALHVPAETINFAMEMDRRCSIISLEEVFKPEDDSLGYEELLDSNGYIETKDYTDERILFKDVIEKLPEDAKILLDMYYKQDLSQKEIAEKLQITQMSVSRRLKKIFNLIYKHISETKPTKGIKG